MSTIKVRLSEGRAFCLQRKLVILNIRSSETSSRASSTDSQQRSAERVNFANADAAAQEYAHPGEL